MTAKPQPINIVDKELGEILDELEKRIKSSQRDTFLPNKLPAENGKFAKLARESAKDITEQQITQLINQKVLEGRIEGGIDELRHIHCCDNEPLAGFGDDSIDVCREKHVERIAELKAELSSAAQPPNTDTLTKGER